MSFSFSVETSAALSLPDLLAAAAVGEPVQLAGAGWTGAPWPKGLFAKIADVASAPVAMDLTPELEASLARAGLSGSFLAWVRGCARGVVVSRGGGAIVFGVPTLASRADYALATKLAAAAAKLSGANVNPEHAPDGAPSEAVSPDELVARFDGAFADANARLMGTWLAEDVASGRTYFFQCPRGWIKLAPEDLRDAPKEERFDRARAIVLGDAEDRRAIDPRRHAVLLTAAMVFAAGADGRLDDEEAQQLEAHFATVRELAAFPARDLLDAVRAEVAGLDALRELTSPLSRRKAFVLASEVIASARGGNLGGDADDPNVKAVTALAGALGLEGDQPFIARVVRAAMAKYAPPENVVVDEAVAQRLALAMILAAAADGVVDDREAAVLSALARTVPELRARDVTSLFAAARARMNEGLEAALRDLGGLDGLEDKCFALAAEVALVAGSRSGPEGAMLHRLQEHVRPDADVAECAISTFAAKYA
ncbi:MAG: hypothetical protein KF819_26285 [Labilithrix sp.]|nr:hypothetical protein [Labilithrix sp.]